MHTALEDSIYQEFELYAAAKRASIFVDKVKKLAIIQATDTYIPIEEFKSLFEKAGTLVKEEGIQKLVFDKRALKVFHQPSMEWYFTTWKTEMLAHGLKTHRKLLPDDSVFRDSVKLGREKILRENPELPLDKMDIKYFESLREAIDN